MTLIPPKAPRLTLADGRAIAIAVVEDIFLGGKFISVLGQNPDGSWFPASASGDQFAKPGAAFDAEVIAAGGANAWLSAVGIPRINKILHDSYQVDMSNQTVQVNGELGQCALSVKNGVPGFYP